MNRLRVGWLRMTGCSGCQLSLLNAEALVAAAAPLLEVVVFPLLSSRQDDAGPLDVALVEGALSVPEELPPLFDLRRRSPFLVAVGACAVSGGVPALAGERRGERFAQVYGEQKSCSSFPPQRISRFVTVDLEVPGCPPEPQELFETLATLARGGLPQLAGFPVCFECRRAENPCLLFETSPCQACLGPLTRAGCGARCPSLGVGCEGCRGDVRGPRREQLNVLLRALGMSDARIEAFQERFGKEGW